MKLGQQIIKSISSYPDLVALYAGNEHLTFEQLGSISHYFGSLLKSTTETRIGIFASRTITPYFSILACFFAGKTYVPLSLKLPPARLAEIIKLAEIKIIFADESCIQQLNEVLSLLPGHSLRVYFRQLSTDHYVGNQFISYNLNDLLALKKVNQYSLIDAEFNVYLMFTSGSTGIPKGIPVSSENLETYINNIQALYNFQPGWKYSQTFDLSFDLSVHDIFVCWTNAGSLYVMGSGDVLNPYKYISSNKLNVWFSVPALGMVLEKQRLLKPGAFPEMKYVFFCGEPLLVSTAQLWQSAASYARVINLYGPTETTIAITGYELPADREQICHLNGVVSIGTVFPEHAFFIGDENGKQTNEGELYLSGKQVTKGYFENQVTTEKVFFTDAEGTRWYRTGDIVQEEEGKIFYKSRKDLQIKWNGYRIELEEVNNHIRSIINVPHVYSIFINDEIKGFRSGIYTVIPVQFEDRIAEIVQQLKQVIPTYMLPQKILVLTDFPTNKNGKVDLTSIKEIIFQ